MLKNTRPCASLAFACFFSLLFVAPTLASPWCDQAFELEPNTVWRGNASEDQTIFRLRLPSPGIATVDLLGVGPMPAWIDALSGTCGERAAKVVVLEQSVDHLVLAVRSAGHLYLRAGATPESSRVIIGFIQAEIAAETFDVGIPGIRGVQTSFLIGGPFAKTEPEEYDPDPGGLNTGSDRIAASVLTLSSLPMKTEPEEYDPDPGGAPVSSPGIIGTAVRRVLHFEPRCRQSEIDDHGDTAICSTSLALGRTAIGELANDWNDDRDVFSFRVTEVSRLEITLATEGADLTYALTDSSGQRLAVDDLGMKDGAGLRLVSMLAPGQYFFRVSGTSGAYALNVTAYD